VISFLAYGRASVPRRGRARFCAPLRFAQRMPPSLLAGMAFICVTLIRRRPNLLVCAAVWAAGAGLFLADVLPGLPTATDAYGFAHRDAVYRAVSAALMIALAAALGLRASFQLPADHAASWVFHVADVPHSRVGLLASAEYVLAAATLCAPIGLVLPFQLHALGAVRTVAAVVLTGLASLVLIQLLLLNWRRVPFTCTLIPGKRNLIHVILIALGAYVVFVSVGAAIITWAIRLPSGMLMVSGALLALFAGMRQRRIERMAAAPLEFEDQLPDTLVTLGAISS
jgi:hypothetical protein